ncbi:MAG: hypothetical protein KF889_22525 [Alphaproteobacteria bacterium]|nr:hypothetical protein [Alphaproteobacteria bacterium]MCW5744416.1 hypothetical protein [Alphaproteobacteria bacterium]
MPRSSLHRNGKFGVTASPHQWVAKVLFIAGLLCLAGCESNADSCAARSELDRALATYLQSADRSIHDFVLAKATPEKVAVDAILKRKLLEGLERGPDGRTYFSGNIPDPDLFCKRDERGQSDYLCIYTYEQKFITGRGWSYVYSRIDAWLIEIRLRPGPPTDALVTRVMHVGGSPKALKC